MIQKFIEELAPYLNQVGNYINEKLNTDIKLLKKVENHIVETNGKRIRPILHILTSLVCSEISHTNIIVASISEFIHTATLLHDDVIDNSTKRRGKPTVNNLWGNELSVMVGDFFYTLSINSLIELNNSDVLKIFSRATQSMTEGEIIQHENERNTHILSEQYFDIINRKTAVLFSACCESAAILASLSKEKIKNLSQFGINLGIAFQLVDDLLDYRGNQEKTGKTVYNDIFENKVTYPLIYALSKGSAQEKNRIKSIFNSDDKNSEEVQFIVDYIEEKNGFQATVEKAINYQNDAIGNLKSFQGSVYYQMLVELSEYITHRVR